MAKYVVSHLDEQMGPFDEHELKGKWVKGELLPIDYVFDDVSQDWVLISEKFPWASGKAEQATPPPLREISVRKKLSNILTKATPAMEEVTAKTPNPFFGKKSEVEEEAPPSLPKTGSIVRPNSHAQAHAHVEYKPTNTEIKTPMQSESKFQTAATATPTPTPTPATAAKTTQVKLADGVGEFDLSLMEPGQVELVLQTSGLSLQQPAKIKVNPAEPFAVEWTVAQHKTVGEEVEIHVRALDRAGHLCSHYEDHFVVRVNGAAGKEFNLQLKSGESRLKIQHTKAETWVLTFHYAGSRVLKLPEDKTMEWQPGPATKLILDTPVEYTAGHSMKVHVKAVDAYGNLAKSYSGTVALEVKAS